MNQMIVYPYNRQWHIGGESAAVVYGFSIKLPNEKRQEYSQESSSLWRLSEMIIHSTRDQILSGTELMLQPPETTGVVIEQTHNKRIRTVKTSLNAQELKDLETMIEERKTRLFKNVKTA